MALSFLDNVDYRGKKPNFTRDLFETVADMVAFSENYLPNVFECNVKDTGERYRYNVNNADVEGLGKWRLVTGSGSGSGESAVTSVNGQTGDVEVTANSIGAVSNEEFSITNAKVLGMETTIGELQTAVENNSDDIADVLLLAEANKTSFENMSASIEQANTNATAAVAKAQAAEDAVSAQQSLVTSLNGQMNDIQEASNRHDAGITELNSMVAGKANVSDVYTTTQVDEKIAGSVSSVYKYMGNVESVDALANVASPADGHVYFVNTESLNYAYLNGNWNPLAGIIDLSNCVSVTDFNTALAGKANTADIKTKTSQLENDENFVTETQMNDALSLAGKGAVQSVNGQSGTVMLTAADVGAISSEEMNTALGDYYTKTDVDTMLGDIASILDEINGEEV